MLINSSGRVVISEEDKLLEQLFTLLQDPDISEKEAAEINEMARELIKNNPNYHSFQLWGTCTESNLTTIEKNMALPATQRALKLFTIINLTDQVAQTHMENYPNQLKSDNEVLVLTSARTEALKNKLSQIKEMKSIRAKERTQQLTRKLLESHLDKLEENIKVSPESYNKAFNQLENEAADFVGRAETAFNLSEPVDINKAIALKRKFDLFNKVSPQQSPFPELLDQIIEGIEELSNHKDLVDKINSIGFLGIKNMNVKNAQKLTQSILEDLQKIPKSGYFWNLIKNSINKKFFLSSKNI